MNTYGPGEAPNHGAAFLVHDGVKFTHLWLPLSEFPALPGIYDTGFGTVSFPEEAEAAGLPSVGERLAPLYGIPWPRKEEKPA